MSLVRKRSTGQPCCSPLVDKLAYTRDCLFRVKRDKPESAAGRGSARNLARCLTTVDLTNLGIGSILGAGIYVVVGQVATNIAGPSILLSFTIAAFASLLSGLCYAEFGSRVPRTTGSAYAYSYHTVGEFIAFIIGWNLILEYMIGTAADARALSSSVDYLLGRRLQNLSLATFGTIPHLNTYPDFLAFALTMLVTLILAIGVKESARYTMVFNVFNGVVALLVILVGSFKGDWSNWATPEVFFPRGAHGVFAGAAACFYAFVGFDIIATTGEEAHNASKSIPTAVALSLVVCYVLYMGVSAVLTLMVPFGSMHSSSPLTEAFDRVGFHWAKWVIGSGAVCGLSASLLGSEFPLPRIIYAMARDGLLFKFLRQVSVRTETPILATVIPGIMTAFFAMLFDLSELVEMMSIGTLLAYSLVCTSILLLRYRHNHRIHRIDSDESDDELGVPMTPLNHLQNSDRSREVLDDPGDDAFAEINEDDEESSMKPLLGSSQQTAHHRHDSTCCYGCCRRRTSADRHPTPASSALVLRITVAVWILSVCLSLLLMFAEGQLEHGSPILLVLTVAIALAIVACCVTVWRQPQDTYTTARLHFKVPLVPWVPMMTIVINVFLMVRLSAVTWIRFAVWMAVGLLVYFGYGIRNSEESLAPLRSEADGQETSPQIVPESNGVDGGDCAASTKSGATAADPLSSPEVEVEVEADGKLGENSESEVDLFTTGSREAATENEEFFSVPLDSNTASTIS